MSMNINATRGHKVTVTSKTLRNGYEYDQEKVRKHLHVGEVYTVDTVSIDSFHSDVTLIEVPGVSFNSVSFEDYVEPMTKIEKGTVLYAIDPCIILGTKYLHSVPMLTVGEPYQVNFVSLMVGKNFDFYVTNDHGVSHRFTSDNWSRYFSTSPPEGREESNEEEDETKKKFHFLNCPRCKADGIQCSYWMGKDCIHISMEKECKSCGEKLTHQELHELQLYKG